MEEKKLVPKLRFPGFTEPWEQRKGDEVFISVSDKGYPQLPVLSASQELGMVYRDENGIDIHHNKSNEDTYKRVLPGQFVIHLRSFQGGFAYSNVEGITSPAYTVITFKNPELHYGLFWKQVFKSLTFIKHLETITYGIRDGRSISFSDFRSLKLCYPTYGEQKFIGDGLEKTDNLITLHQRKLEHLKLKKKSLLQKLFPKEGEVYPELRFPGFTDPWEQRKLKHVVELRGRIGFRGYTEKDIISKEQGGLLTFSPTNIIDDQITFNCKNTYITKTKYDESPEIKIINGDILFVKTGSTLGKSALVTELLEDATINPQIVLMRPNELNPEFLANMMITNDIMVQVRRSKIGGAVPTLTETNIKEFDIFIPTEKDESNRIGNIFKNINQLITLHQRKLEHLQLLKKALLQQLFV